MPVDFAVLFGPGFIPITINFKFNNHGTKIEFFSVTTKLFAKKIAFYGKFLNLDVIIFLFSDNFSSFT